MPAQPISGARDEQADETKIRRNAAAGAADEFFEFSQDRTNHDIRPLDP
ncbi:MAG: hypothetical protein ACREH8_13135 [Opitutaceae bacterium]